MIGDMRLNCPLNGRLLYKILHQNFRKHNPTPPPKQGFNKVGVVSIQMPKNGILLDQHARWLSRAVVFRPYRNQ